MWLRIRWCNVEGRRGIFALMEGGRKGAEGRIEMCGEGEEAPSDLIEGGGKMEEG